jgi:hypothetical protein
MKKKINIALIVVIVVVYGGIAYKYFRNAAPQEQIITATPTGNELPIPENIGEQENVFILDLSNRDPFLDKKYQLKNATSSISQKKATRSNAGEKMMTMHWPAITYLGFSKSNQQAKKTAILRVDGKLYRKREGSVIDHIKILKVVGDSMYVMFNNKEKKYFYKNAE